MNNTKELKDIEFEILKLIYENYTTQEIGKIVCLSNSAIKAYKNNIYNKLNAKNKIDAVLIALRKGYLEL